MINSCCDATAMMDVGSHRVPCAVPRLEAEQNHIQRIRFCRCRRYISSTVWIDVDETTNNSILGSNPRSHNLFYLCWISEETDDPAAILYHQNPPHTCGDSAMESVAGATSERHLLNPRRGPPSNYPPLKQGKGSQGTLQNGLYGGPTGLEETQRWRVGDPLRKMRDDIEWDWWCDDEWKWMFEWKMKTWKNF